jgi:hypothetical protein
MDKIQMIIPQFHTVTRSFSKKVNLERHVPGFKYEAEDFFASHGESIPVEEATPEKVREVSSRLYDTAKTDVETDVASRINELRKAAGIATIPTGQEFDVIKDLIGGIENSKNAADIEAVIELIKTREGLTEEQKEYLRSAVRKAKAKIK